MKKIKKTPGKQIAASYTPEEMQRFRTLFERSMCKSVSEYIRKRTLEQPIRFRWRNQSFDGFVEEIVLLRKAMEAITARHDWTPDEKQRLLAIQTDVKSVINKIVDVCSPT